MSLTDCPPWDALFLLVQHVLIFQSDTLLSVCACWGVCLVGWEWVSETLEGTAAVDANYTQESKVRTK